MATIVVGVDGSQNSYAALRWAIALALSDDAKGLDALRRKLDAAMADNPAGDLFRGIVGSGAADPAQLHTIAKTTAQLDAFQAFMTQYREKVRATPLSLIN